MPEEVFKDVSSRMGASIEHLSRELGAIRTGRACGKQQDCIRSLKITGPGTLLSRTPGAEAPGAATSGR